MPIEKTSPFTAKELTVYAEELEQLAATMRAAAEVASAGDGIIYAFRKSSLDKMRERLTSFHAALVESVRQVELGQPYDEDSQKGRVSKSAQVKKTGRKGSGKPRG